MRELRTAALLVLVAVVITVGAVLMMRSRSRVHETAGAGQSLLVTTDWLAARLDDPSLVVLHVGRDSSRYLESHVPGARFLPISTIVVERDGLPNEIPDTDDLVSVFEAHGVGDNSQVVLYGDYRGLWAARVFFTLDYLGLGDRTALLDGGLEVWRSEGRAVSREHPAAVRASFTARPRTELVVDAAWIEQRRDRSTIALVDARPEEQYRGDDPGSGIARAGHIPGAVSLFWETALESNDRPVLRDAEALRAMFRAQGIEPGDTVVTYCRSGVQASHAYFVARLLGYPLKLYDGSFIDWSNHTTYPVEP